MKYRMLLLILVLASGLSQAQDELKKGELACYTQKALLKVQQAQGEDAQRTIDWLLGDACVIIPRNMKVFDVEHLDNQTKRVTAKISGRDRHLFVTATQI
jgi:hypothetical protein